MFRVYWTNHEYFSAEEFATFEAAAAYGRSKCFEFTIFDPAGELIYGWSPIGGGRFHGSARLAPLPEVSR